MRLRDLAYETATALDANRGRSLLTVLGIVIGISAVIAMTALINGMKLAMVQQLGLTQARMVYISVWSDRGVKLEDVEGLRERLPQYEYLAATSYGGAEVKTDKKTVNCSVQGVQTDFFKVMGYGAKEGKFFTQRDDDSGSLVCVLDQGAVKQLYGKPDTPCAGNTIYLNNLAFRIVGVIDSAESYMDGSGNIYIPFLTNVQRISGWDEVGDIRGLARDDIDMAQLAKDTKYIIEDYFGIEHRPEGDEGEENIYDYDSLTGDVYVMTMQSIIDDLNSTMMTFQLMITAVASISLLVGGIGIMNMMLTNVTERIREIGLRKALGARASDITKQFLLESICLCLAGGVIGIACGYGGAYLLGQFATGLMTELNGTEGGPVTPVIDTKSVLMVAGICIAIGIIFGYYPARRAAKLDPVESLHYQ